MRKKTIPNRGHQVDWVTTPVRGETHVQVSETCPELFISLRSDRQPQQTGGQQRSTTLCHKTTMSETLLWGSDLFLQIYPEANGLGFDAT